VDFAPRHGRTGETGPSSIKWTSKYGSVVATGYDSNVSVPYGLNTPEEPNISSTCWRTVVDHKRRLYLFESALTPNTLWVDLKAIDLSPASGNVLKLDLGPTRMTLAPVMRRRNSKRRSRVSWACTKNASSSGATIDTLQSASSVGCRQGATAS
jgi:penicillin V acylase-like amidase (Ntn superfamily)